MRIFAVLVLLGLTAGCVAPPPQATAPGTVPTASAIAAFLGPPPPAVPPPVALVPGPAPVPAVAPLGVELVPVMSVSGSGYTWVGPVPIPFSWLWGPEPGGRLTLNNFSVDEAHVQVMLTNRPDCAVADPAATADFMMPLNATRVIATPPGLDICWRRAVPPTGSAKVVRRDVPVVPGWADWNRAYTASGRYIDMRL